MILKAAKRAWYHSRLHDMYLLSRAVWLGQSVAYRLEFANDGGVDTFESKGMIMVSCKIDRTRVGDVDWIWS